MVPKNEKWPAIAGIIKKVFPVKMDKTLKLSFIRTSFRFYSALVILEPQIYVVVKQFGAENISLLSGRLAFLINCS